MTAFAHVRYALAAAALATTAAGCLPSADPGEWGVVRYFAEIPGEVPMRLIPPVTDRAGNVYVLHGNRIRPEAEVHVGRTTGGWIESCDIHKSDDRGVHGWVGTAEDQAWYWSGDALVKVSGRGDCEQILDRDPTSQASLFFEGVYPWIKEQPSRIRAAALLQTPRDEAPYHAIVELDVGQYTDVREFEPPLARNVEIAGVGADRSRKELYTLVSYDLGDERVVEGRVSTFQGEILHRTRIEGIADLQTDAVVGYLEGRQGLVAGLLEDDRVVVFGDGWSEVHAPETLEVNPAGVHKHRGELWLVGLDDGRAALSEITMDGLGAAVIWRASERAATSLGGAVPVRDEREEPYVFVEWSDPKSAIGQLPFLSPFTPEKYADGMTGWLVAGPRFDNSVEGMTAVAFAPVGLSYP